MPLRDMQELKSLSPAGLYAFSPTKPLVRGKTLMKIGRTVNCRTRLNQYHICYNEGFYIAGWLPLNAIQYDLRLKENRAHAIELTMRMEARMFTLLQRYNVKTTTRKYHSEWFNLTLKELHAAFNKVYREFIHHCTEPWLEIWMSPPLPTGVMQEMEDMAELETMPDPPSYLPQPGSLSRRSGRTIRTPSKFRDSMFID